MNPLIREYSAFVPFDPVSYTWIDFASGPMPTEEDARNIREKIGHLPFSERTPNQDWPLPFEKMCLLLPVRVEGSMVKKGIMTVTLERRGDALVFQQWTNTDSEHASIVITSTGCLWDDRDIRVSPRFAAAIKKDIKDCAKHGAQSLMVALRRIVAMTVLGQDEHVVIARCTGDAVVNAKRVRKGKRPFFEWTTVEVKPRAAVQESKGGTHASPKPHMRRGHIRRLKSGKVVVIKNTIINRHKMPDEGFVFHDYKA